jgi:hypothetical protein
MEINDPQTGNELLAKDTQEKTPEVHTETPEKAPKPKLSLQFIIPKFLSDFAVIAFVLPLITYYCVYLYKLGRYNHFIIPPRFIEIGINELAGFWLFAFYILFSIALPFYPLFIPSLMDEVDANSIPQKPKAETRTDKIKKWISTNIVERVLSLFSDRLSPWLRRYSLPIIGSLLLTVPSIILLSVLRSYVSLVYDIAPIIGASMLGLTIFMVFTFVRRQSDKTRASSGTFFFRMFGASMALVMTSIAIVGVGEHYASQQTKFFTLCNKDNMVRVAIDKSGDKIIAKVIDISKDKDHRTFDRNFVLIGTNCEEQVFNYQETGALKIESAGDNQNRND